MMTRNVVLAGSASLEDGEIRDDEDLDDIRRNTSISTVSENVTQISSTSIDEEREREVDRIIREVQEATDRSRFMGAPTSGHLVQNLTSDNDGLSLAVLNTNKDGRFVRRPASYEAEEGEIIETSCMVSGNQHTNVHSSARQTWVQLKPRQNSKVETYSDMQSRVSTRKFHETAVPLKVTVRNDNANGYSCWILNNQQKMMTSASNGETETTVKQFSNPFEEQLHRLRLRVEASKFSKKMENLGDNYDQVGMDIVDSDRDSRSRSSPLVDAIVVRSHEMQTQNGIPSDCADNEEDVDQLRAELLEQIMQRKNDKKLMTLKSSLEEGELSSLNSEEQVGDAINEGPSSSSRAETHCSKRFKSDIEQNRKSLLNRKRPRKDDSFSSDTDNGQIQNCRIKLLRRRKEDFQESFSKRFRWQSKDEFGAVEGRKAEDWERMIGSEKKLLKEIERKLRHREDQKNITRRKRDSFLERANRCARQLGALEAEMEVLRCDQEKSKGRLSYLERQLNKVQSEESYKGSGRKAMEKERSKRMEQLTEDVERTKIVNKDIGHIRDHGQLVLRSKSGTELLGTMKTHVTEQSEPINTVAAMDYSDEREDVSRPTSSSELQHSPVDILGDSDVIELSDSSDSLNGLITAMRELEQEELEANFIAETEPVNRSIVCQKNPQQERKISRTVTLSEEDINELKNNPLIMFNGYRMSSTFPYRLIAHRALSNKLDPLKPLCYYELLGRCADPTCPMQHEEDYLMSDEELICSVLAYCPNLCPPKKMFSEYAREILKENGAKPVGEIIENLLESLPDTERRIAVCEVAVKCKPPSIQCSRDDEQIEYEVPQLSCSYK